MRSITEAAVAGGMALLVGAAIAGSALAEPPAPGVVTTSVAMSQEGTLTADLAYSRDEERMARDLYTLFGQIHHAPIFDRIATSEQAHFDAVGTLLTTYGVADPAAGLPAGTYADGQLQARYDQWKAQGQESLDAALAVGAALEQADIADLEGFIARTAQPDAQQVFTHLLAASRHHLAAFTGPASGGTCSVSGSGMGAMSGAAGSGAGRMGSDPDMDRRAG